MKTKAEVIKIHNDWIVALTNGKYSQGTHFLKREEDTGAISHCCLGVLCEIMNVSSDKTRADKGKFDHVEFIWFFEGKEGILPDSVVDDLGLVDSTYAYQSIMPSFTRLNDEGASFNCIANFIKDIVFNLENCYYDKLTSTFTFEAIESFKKEDEHLLGRDERNSPAES